MVILRRFYWSVMVSFLLWLCLFPADCLSVSFFFFFFNGSPSVRFYGAVGKYATFGWIVSHLAEGSHFSCVVLAAASAKPLQNTLISLAVTAHGRALRRAASLALVLEVGHSSRGGWLLGVSVRGLGSTGVSIVRLQSQKKTLPVKFQDSPERKHLLLPVRFGDLLAERCAGVMEALSYRKWTSSCPHTLHAKKHICKIWVFAVPGKAHLSKQLKYEKEKKSESHLLCLHVRSEPIRWIFLCLR